MLPMNVMNGFRNSLLRIILFGSLYLLALILQGCTGSELELENTVRAYNRKYSDALAGAGEGVMDFFVTPRQKRRIGSLIVSIRKDKRLLVTELAFIEFDGISVSEGATEALVRTRERWENHFIDMRTRKRLTNTEESSFKSIYHLVRMDGRWVVDRIESRAWQAGEPE